MKHNITHALLHKHLNVIFLKIFQFILLLLFMNIHKYLILKEFKILFPTRNLYYTL